MTSEKFHKLFGMPPRQSEGEMGQKYMDLAASIQVVTEEVMLKVVEFAHQVTNQEKLCLAGGVALNCVGNGRILREGPFSDMWIQPASGDAGGALGIAQFIWHQLLENKRNVSRPDMQRGSLLGPAYETGEVKAFLESEGVSYSECRDDADLAESVAGLLDAGNVIGWMQGRMEFGPRALGARSILGDARSREMQATINLKIKFRESFRPFAPAVLEEHANEYFELNDSASPYMLLVAPVKESHRLDLSSESAALKGVDQREVVRSTLPAITHVDYSARVQSVAEGVNPRFRTLLEVFFQKTGSPMVVNTSFNIRGEPIVCSPADAYRCFMGTNMDVLVMDRFIIKKDDRSGVEEVAQVSRQKYISQFPLD